MPAKATLRLLRDLGPWGEGRVPPGVVVETRPVPPLVADDPPMRARVYAPIDRRPIGAYLIAHGLHYAGPDDPRMDRFLRVLAHAGFLVVCPYLPSFTSLVVDASVTRELLRGLHLLRALRLAPATRPGVFSISFGSLPAFRLAALDEARDELAGLVVFGGYADFAHTVAFALGDVVDAPLAPPRDPLNLPVLVKNLQDGIDDPRVHRPDVHTAWDRFVRATWGRPEMKARDRLAAIAHEIAAPLDDDARAFFLMSCGVTPGAVEMCQRALTRLDLAAVDPRPCFPHIRARVAAIHGVDDDVIPYTELARIRAAFPPHAHVDVFLTGLFAHTGASGEDARRGRGRARALVEEAQAFRGMLRAVVDIGRDA